MSEATDSFHMNATIMNIKNDKKSVVSHTQTEMQIIARTGQLAAPTGNWGAGKTTVTIDLASSYQGEVWIAYNMELIENRQDGIIISGVRFIAAAAAKAEERDDEQPQDYEISPGRMAAIEGNAVYCSEDDMGFGGGYMAFVDPGMAWKIGTLDLSKYSSVQITYGSDVRALFAKGSDTFIALTTKGAIQSNGLMPRIPRCEILLVLEGETELLIQNRAYRIRPGQMLIHFINEYEYKFIKQPYCHVNLHIPENAPVLMQMNNTLRSIFFPYGESASLQVIDVSQYPEILSLFQQIKNDIAFKGVYKDELLECRILELCIFLFRRCPEYFNVISGRNGKMISETKQYIDDHYNEDIKISDIARRYNFSTSYFINIFKKMTGYSPKKYMLLRRIERARFFLTNTNMSISEIAETTGMEDSNSLIRLFRKVTGISPGKFRKNKQ